MPLLAAIQHLVSPESETNPYLVNVILSRQRDNLWWHCPAGSTVTHDNTTRPSGTFRESRYPLSIITRTPRLIVSKVDSPHLCVSTVVNVETSNSWHDTQTNLILFQAVCRRIPLAVYKSCHAVTDFMLPICMFGMGTGSRQPTLGHTATITCIRSPLHHHHCQGCWSAHGVLRYADLPHYY